LILNIYQVNILNKTQNPKQNLNLNPNNLNESSVQSAEYIFKAILHISSETDLNVFFEENLYVGCSLLPAIYLHVKKDYLGYYRLSG